VKIVVATGVPRASGAVLAVVGGEMPAAHDSSIESSSALHGHASVGLGATAVGAFIGLSGLAAKALTGVTKVSGEAGVVRLSAVLIQTGAMLVGIGPLVSVVRRIFST
jgi:hypothetical protein